MQRHEMIAAMRNLGLKGMAGAFDEAVTAGVQRQRTTPEILTDLLRAEAAHRHSASIRYRMTAAKLPVVKDIDAFVFHGTPVNEGLVRSLHAGSFLPVQRNIVLVGGTGTGKTHLAPRHLAPSPPASSAPVPVAATSTPSIWSPGSRRRPASARLERWRRSSPASISSSSMNLATCRSPAQAASCCSTLSASCTNVPR